MKLPIYQVDAFTDSLFKGNPAAVCPLDAWLADGILQAIAMENNLSETAFFVGGEGTYEIRWFTPNKEVPLCGHATLASAHVIFEELEFGGTEILLHSKSGELKVEKKGGGYILDFPAQDCVPIEISETLVKALGRRPEALFHGADFMAVFESEAVVKGIVPDFRLLETLEARGVIITAPGNEVDFVSRFFAPKFGINEDPVTGSAHCQLAPYWADRLGKTQLSGRQVSKRTGELRCEVRGERVFISGKTVLYLRGCIEVH